MNRFIIAVVLSLLLTAICFPQVPEWSGYKATSITDVPIPGHPEPQPTYDVASDGYGHHVVVPRENGNVEYTLVGNDGVSLRPTQVIQTNATSPSVVTYQGMQRIVLSHNNTIKIYQSTNGGETWSQTFVLNHSSAQDASHIDAVWDFRGTHIVWYSGSTFNVHYSLCRTQDGVFVFTTQVSEEFGYDPSVAISQDRAHVAYRAAAWRTRDYDFVSQQWFEVLPAQTLTANLWFATGLAHGSELHLFTTEAIESLEEQEDLARCGSLTLTSSVLEFQAVESRCCQAGLLLSKVMLR